MTPSKLDVESITHPPATPPCRTAAGAISTPPPAAPLSSPGTEGPDNYLGPPRRTQTGSRQQTGEPLAVDAAGLGWLVDLDRSSVWKAHSAGKIPNPVYLGSKSPRWVVSEIRAWLLAGAPDRRTWERMKRDQAGKGGGNG